MEHTHHARQFRRDLLRDAALTFAAVVLAFAALDDITTDKAANFIFERLGLAACAVWLFIVAWRLVRGGHLVLGVVSVIVLVASAAAQFAIGPGTVPLQFEYLVMMAGLVWFLSLAGIFAVFAWRSDNGHAA